MVCRALEDGGKLLEELKRNGMVRGAKGLEVWVMCEIPKDLILKREFSALVDGFPTGSNDLTQLAPGVDRDSELLAAWFSELDAGVKRLVALRLAAAAPAQLEPL